MTVPERGRTELGALLRFALVGGGFSVFYAVASAALINHAGTPPFATSVVVFALCIPPAFLTQQHFAFRAKTLRKHAFWIYAATQIGSIAVVSTLTTRFVTYNMVLDTLIMGGTVVIAALVSFLIGRFITFNPPG